MCNSSTADCQRSPLTVGKLLTAIVLALIHLGKQIKSRANTPRARSHGNFQVFEDGERGKDFAFLRHVAEPGMNATVNSHARNVDVAQQQTAFVKIGMAHDGGEQGSLADAVAADHGKTLARRE